MKITKEYLREKIDAGKTLITGLFSEKIRPDILKKTLKEHKAMCAAFVLAFALFVSCLAVIPRLQTEPPRYELETAGGEIDFAAPEIKVHTAADGIAVIGTLKDAVDLSPVPLTAEPAKLIADPAAIWQEEPAPTHGGFTLPVQMNDESIGVLTIPDIGLSVRVYESEDEMEAMNKGAAHFKSTSSWAGNIGISAHNINFNGTAGYFLNLYKLQKGAVIRYETALGKREYKVESVTEISETDWSMLGRTQDNRITLITCITGKPAMRLCVQAVEK